MSGASPPRARPTRRPPRAHPHGDGAGPALVRLPQMQAWRPRRRRVTTNSSQDSVITAMAVAMAAPLMPMKGIKPTQAVTLTANAVA